MKERNNLLELLYAKTNDGLDIINRYCPQSAEVGVGKMFKFYPDEHEPSAHVFRGKASGHYCVKNFSQRDGARCYSPIDIYMYANGYSQDDFVLALKELCQEYGVETALDKNVNRAKIEWIDKTACTFDLNAPFELKEGFTKDELDAFGTNVQSEHLVELGWSAASWVGRVYTEKVKVSHSNENYPIFVQRNEYVSANGTSGVFWKVYEAKAFDKKDRFFYIGTPPKDYVFGLSAARAKAAKLEDGKLNEIAIVSGGTDAANCLAMGIQPVYFGSESAMMPDSVFSQLKQIARFIINIPDVDEPGIAAGKGLALQHIDIRTVWLPSDVMARFRNSRGRKYKDLKDWVSLYPNKEKFRTLVRSAKPAKFWSSKEDQNGELHWECSLTHLCYFLWLNNFYTLHDEYARQTRFVLMQGIKVKEVTVKEIVAFVTNWMNRQGLSYKLQDTVLRSRDINALLNHNLREVKLNFRSGTSDSQRFYASNCVIEVTKDSIVKRGYKELGSTDRYVWEKDILPFAYVPMEPMFRVSRKDDGRYAIEVLSKESELFCFLINASRLHWRKEMEERFNGDRKAMAEYAATHRFCIDGEGLTEEEIAEQMQCLVNKIYCYGYLLHDFKQSSLAWAVICYDSFMSENDECNGRSGKSLYGKALRYFASNVFIEAKNPKITDRQYIFANVTEDTRLLLIDECHKNLDYDFFFGRITGDFEKEAKYENPHSIPFEDSPKIMLSSNFVIKKDDSSTKARMLQNVFSDYYHMQAGTTDYLEDRSVRDDFGHDLFDSQYQGWNADLNFLLFCEQFYLSVKDSGEKILPPMGIIKKRQQKAVLGTAFELWAKEALAEGSDFVDQTVARDKIWSDCVKVRALTHLTPDQVFAKICEYAAYADHLHCVNPADITGKAKDGEKWRKHETKGQVYYIHIRSKSKAEEMARTAQPQQTSIVFDDGNAENADDMPF